MTTHLDAAVAAAREAGALLHKNFGGPVSVNEFHAHDIKLELDVRAQQLIQESLLSKFPDHAIYGEEGIIGGGDHEWIIDPIDGTVNFFYSIPHFCISIALRCKAEMLLGVIYDPMRDELWQVERGQPPTLNGEPVRVSERTLLGDAVLSIGFSKNKATIDAGLPLFEKMIYRARKCRTMGSAALDMAYVASGRLDAYIEQSVSLWDIAAGWQLIEAAGGRVEVTPRADARDKFSVIASNGKIDLAL